MIHVLKHSFKWLRDDGILELHSKQLALIITRKITIQQCLLMSLWHMNKRMDKSNFCTVYLVFSTSLWCKVTFLSQSLNILLRQFDLTLRFMQEQNTWKPFWASRWIIHSTDLFKHIDSFRNGVIQLDYSNEYKKYTSVSAIYFGILP